MEHFANETWTDFVRGASVANTAHDVEAHLADGCSQCETTLRFWRSVLAFAEHERFYAPPAGLVQQVKLGFSRTSNVQTDVWAMGALVFDSWESATPVGVRGATMAARQVVYEGEGLTVDLRFDRMGTSNTICAAGQVLDKEATPSALGNTAVVLWTEEGQLLATTEANEFGEFQLEFPMRDRLRLSIAMAGRRTLRISLGSLR